MFSFNFSYQTNQSPALLNIIIHGRRQEIVQVLWIAKNKSRKMKDQKMVVRMEVMKTRKMRKRYVTILFHFFFHNKQKKVFVCFIFVILWCMVFFIIHYCVQKWPLHRGIRRASGSPPRGTGDDSNVTAAPTTPQVGGKPFLNEISLLIFIRLSLHISLPPHFHFFFAFLCFF